VGCIVAAQNSAQGSKYLGPFYRRNNCHMTAHMKAGDPFVMQIDPKFDCGQVANDAIPKCNGLGPRQAGSDNNGLFIRGPSSPRPC
jgi:hypothetical protein